MKEVKNKLMKAFNIESLKQIFFQKPMTAYMLLKQPTLKMLTHLNRSTLATKIQSDKPT
jgi:hypothetical protein